MKRPVDYKHVGKTLNHHVFETSKKFNYLENEAARFKVRLWQFAIIVLMV